MLPVKPYYSTCTRHCLPSGARLLSNALSNASGPSSTPGKGVVCITEVGVVDAYFTNTRTRHCFSSGLRLLSNALSNANAEKSEQTSESKNVPFKKD